VSGARADPGGLIVVLDGDEGRLIVEALAECPFKTVFELIGRLNRQANSAPAGDAAGAARQFTLSRADFALIVGALVKLPFERVHLVLRNLERQAGDQPQARPPAAPRQHKQKPQ